jgi:hypothetical protein
MPRRRHYLAHTNRTALLRSQHLHLPLCKSLLLWTNLPRREIKDTMPHNQVLGMRYRTHPRGDTVPENNQEGLPAIKIFFVLKSKLPKSCRLRKFLFYEVGIFSTQPS